MNFGHHKQQSHQNLRCPECGADLSDSSPGTPCSACLLKLGMQTWQAGAGNPTMQPTTAPDGSPSFQPVIEPDLAKKFPHLEILHLVARGGMGDVYCARQTSLDRLVALKIIRPDVQSALGFADRFVREAQALAKLSHQNIVTVYDFGQTDGVYYFIMEYIDGINLRQMLRSGKLGPRQALEIVPAVCDALQFAHDKGIVHRDIKPDNILMDGFGDVKLCDLGLIFQNGMKDFGEDFLAGSPHYLSPEEIQGVTVDTRSDIFSLGASLFHLISGELPYKGETIREILFARIEQPPPNLIDFNPAVKPALAKAIMQMMEPDINYRFQSGQECIEALENSERTTLILRRPNTNQNYNNQ